MTTQSKIKSRFNQVLLKTDARNFAKIINKSVYTVSNQDHIKMSLSIKNVVAMNVMCPIIKVYHLVILSIL